MRRHPVAFLLACWATLALADLPRPVDRDLMQRFDANPRAVDVTDLYCEGRGVGDACEVPGGVLAGAGPGTCQRRMDVSNRRIELLCITPRLPPIDRGLPEDPWQADAKVCTTPALRALAAERPGWRCDDTPVVMDRFCEGLADGARCEVDVAGQPVRHPGVCKPRPATTRRWMDGVQWTLTRTERVCVAETAAPPRTERIPVSPWRKLLQ